MYERKHWRSMGTWDLRMSKGLFRFRGSRELLPHKLLRPVLLLKRSKKGKKKIQAGRKPNKSMMENFQRPMKQDEKILYTLTKWKWKIQRRKDNCPRRIQKDPNFGSKFDQGRHKRMQIRQWDISKHRRHCKPELESTTSVSISGRINQSWKKNCLHNVLSKR